MGNNPDLLSLHELMLRSRKFEEVVKTLWEEGKISGEMHLGIGEEAIVAGIVSQLKDGDAMALDHRGTAPLIMRGTEPVALLLEMLGNEEGLCGGNGGHMHLFSKDILAASSGIVGSSGPAACGFALAAQYRKTGGVAIAFFGEGAMNQGMMLESLNLSSAWKLPVLFVCKDNGWAITTRSAEVTGGDILERVKAFGIEAARVDGLDVEAVWLAAHQALEKMRKASGPFFLHAKCIHVDGHFLGDPLLKFHESPIKSFTEVAGPLLRSMTRLKGAGFIARAREMGKVFSLIGKSGKQLNKKQDPKRIAEEKLEAMDEVLSKLEESIDAEMRSLVTTALATIEGGKRA